MSTHHDFYKGMVHLKNNEFELAKDYFQDIINQYPDHAEAHAWLAATYGRLMELGSMMDKVMLLPIFEQEVATALELDNELVLARQVNGLRLIHTPKDFGGSPEEGIRELEYVLDKGVREGEVFYALGLAYLATGQMEMAEGAFVQALICEPEHILAQQQIDFLHKGASS